LNFAVSPADLPLLPGIGADLCLHVTARCLLGCLLQLVMALLQLLHGPGRSTSMACCLQQIEDAAASLQYMQQAVHHLRHLVSGQTMIQLRAGDAIMFKLHWKGCLLLSRWSC